MELQLRHRQIYNGLHKYGYGIQSQQRSSHVRDYIIPKVTDIAI